ncbi:uncharacterized protein LOC134839962 [Symsagittifera roscoffensis]|uniref:uncharacterized protein LOC134839962 n=1 Tax=Symsagittifera roscoffensis TaxID=84072 RepID=UPI00307B835B
MFNSYHTNEKSYFVGGVFNSSGSGKVFPIPIGAKSETSSCEPIYQGKSNLLVHKNEASDPFFCSKRLQKDIEPLVPKLDLSPLDSDSEKVKEVRPNVQWDILIAVQSPKCNKPKQIGSVIPKLDVHQDTNSLSSTTILTLHEISAKANPWDLKRPLDTYTVIDNSSNYENLARFQKPRHLPPNAGFLRRYSKAKAQQFVKRISASDASASGSAAIGFDEGSMLRPLTLVSWSSLERPQYLIQDDMDMLLYYNDVKFEKPAEIKFCSKFKLKKERSRIEKPTKSSTLKAVQPKKSKRKIRYIRNIVTIPPNKTFVPSRHKHIQINMK